MLLHPDASAGNREAAIQRVLDDLKMKYPLEVVINPPERNGGGVTGGFMWDADSTMLVWAYDGQMMRLQSGQNPEAIRRYLYIGASHSGSPKAQRLEIGSEREEALRCALELFCEDNFPSTRFDSLNTALQEAMSEAERDAIRLWPVVRSVATQQRRVSSK